MNIITPLPKYLLIENEKIEIKNTQGKYYFTNDLFCFYNILFQEKLFLIKHIKCLKYFLWSPIKINFCGNGFIKNNIYLSQSKNGLIGIKHFNLNIINYSLTVPPFEILDLIIHGSQNLMNEQEQKYMETILNLPSDFRKAAFYGKISTPVVNCNQKQNKGFLYLLELDGCLKIGFTRNLAKRINSYKTGNIKVILLAFRKSTLTEEKEIHKRLNNGQEKYKKTRLEELLNIFGQI